MWANYFKKIWISDMFKKIKSTIGGSLWINIKRCEKLNNTLKKF
ncbi:hypothetical protein GF867_03270 [Aerococcaceae bacterium DSM 109652]|uniref:Uncharacterized protein n=1 Tax=Fundicoccus ignavus TaxID=2664442 RepID=A0A844CBQ2_9LACT|nr:hypothetical protein [Fundicoccus ignavus]